MLQSGHSGKMNRSKKCSRIMRGRGLCDPLPGPYYFLVIWSSQVPGVIVLVSTDIPFSFTYSVIHFSGTFLPSILTCRTCTFRPTDRPFSSHHRIQSVPYTGSDCHFPYPKEARIGLRFKKSPNKPYFGNRTKYMVHVFAFYGPIPRPDGFLVDPKNGGP